MASSSFFSTRDHRVSGLAHEHRRDPARDPFHRRPPRSGSGPTSTPVRTAPRTGIRAFRERHSPENIHFFKSLAPEDFIRLLDRAQCIVGNSSVGIRECSFLGSPPSTSGDAKPDGIAAPTPSTSPMSAEPFRAPSNQPGRVVVWLRIRSTAAAAPVGVSQRCWPKRRSASKNDWRTETSLWPRRSGSSWARRRGDNAQLLALAQALGLPTEERRLEYNLLRCLPNWLLGASTVSVKRGGERLCEPWPDIVLGIGQRSAPVARAVKRMSAGQTRIVQLGRPRADLDRFDLIITTPQYQLPLRENLVPLTLPLNSARPDALAEARERWRTTLFEGGPTIALLLGGNAAPYRFDRKAIDRLLRGALALADERSASVLVTCGRRMPEEAAQAIRDGLGDRCRHFHRFGGPADENPYLAYLAGADELVVSSESVSMMADAVASGRPLRLFEPSRHTGLRGRGLELLWGLLRRLPQPRLDRWIASGKAIPPRDVSIIGQRILGEGLALSLESNQESTVRRPPTTDPVPPELLARLRAMLPPSSESSS